MKQRTDICVTFIIKKLKVKLKILILFFFLNYLTSESQTLQLKIIGKTSIETKIIDSIGYSIKKQNAKQIIEEINLVTKKLTELGYINNQILEEKKKMTAVILPNFHLKKE
ncbi:hypothetical protein [Flavobacterium sp. 1]|uniref:hypothetical protein n=1 Tax=Flavobacterium sp. 1 TaxID=2035200 RepID=UPI001E38FC71|nr:hypothetical protein [Flavobacterium sp. 1]